MAIKNWPIEERPREKLIRHGPAKLSDAELLAILLNTGVRGKNALDLARDLLGSFGSMKKLMKADFEELIEFPGMGESKGALLAAIVEMSTRYRDDFVEMGETINTCEKAKGFFKHRLKYDHEVFACLFLSNNQKIIGYEELFHGSINQSAIYPREVVKKCLSYNAAKLIVAHNHPSGDPTPSKADCEITLFLKVAVELVDVLLVDHIIVGNEKCVSMKEEWSIEWV